MMNPDTNPKSQSRGVMGLRRIVLIPAFSLSIVFPICASLAAAESSAGPASAAATAPTNSSHQPRSKSIIGVVPKEELAAQPTEANRAREASRSAPPTAGSEPPAAAPQAKSATPVATGPEKPIGHSLKTPEAQKRIEMIMANAHQEGKIGELTAAPAPSSATRPLVNGQYGFSTTGVFEGVPKALVNLGSNTPAYAFVVEKLHHRLSVFRLNSTGKYEVVKTYRAISGRDPGDKVSRGDLRTPEGIYFITGKLNDDSLPPKYGRMAFTLDYPNIYDKRQRKSGYGIWIHATDDPKRLQKPFDTEGCVVLSNEDVADLEKYINFFEVPVVITKEMTSVKEEELLPTRKKAMEMVEAWRKAWESSSFDSYMSYYSQNFRSLGKNKNQWETFKASLGNKRGSGIQITISEPKIVAFEDQLLVVFLQDYQSQEHSDFGRKFLYLQWEGDRYRIIAEKWYRSPKSDVQMRALKSQTPSKQL
jgi:murein L,D-transpeptidase YafK